MDLTSAITPRAINVKSEFNNTLPDGSIYYEVFENPEIPSKSPIPSIAFPAILSEKSNPISSPPTFPPQQRNVQRT